MNVDTDTFGALTLVDYAGHERGYAVATFRCVCGVVSTKRLGRVISGEIKSCGCLRRAAVSKRNRTHGETGRTTDMPRTVEYAAWVSMKNRCYASRQPRFKDWGGRGITVCDRWRSSYENFLADMGRKPSPTHSLDRIDNDGNYEPGNVRWATRQEQYATRGKRRSA